jgi:hypothetical protein
MHLECDHQDKTMEANLKKGAGQLISSCFIGFALGFLILAASNPISAQHGSAAGAEGTDQPSLETFDCGSVVQGSPYIPIDSWIYPAVYRLYSLGYVHTPFLNLRPWTRKSVSNMLEDSEELLMDAEPSGPEDEAEAILDALKHELREEMNNQCDDARGSAKFESAYSALRTISSAPLRDSFHLGSTIVNDFGRPYAKGLNNYSGLSGYLMAGRFTLYMRPEIQTAPQMTAYSQTLAQRLAAIDGTKYYYSPSCWATGSGCNPMPLSVQATIPQASVQSAKVRFLEGYVSAQLLNHVISFGKQDFWQSPARGGSFSYSNNAENLYSFRINRIEPLFIPFLSHLTGPFRYEFMIGPLRGHSYPRNPWVHIEKVAFSPTENLEFGFERTVIWGGKGHTPVTTKSFLKSFVSLSAPDSATKNSREDPGARFGAFDFSYKLPFLRNWLTLYADGEVHDDVSPIDAPRRASWRPGLYLTHVPGVSKMDIRSEAAWTDPPVQQSFSGQFMYWEYIQRQ